MCQLRNEIQSREPTSLIQDFSDLAKKASYHCEKEC